MKSRERKLFKQVETKSRVRYWIWKIERKKIEKLKRNRLRK